MAGKRITIREVAKYAGVSIGTVSRFINSSGYVGKEARDKIEDAVKQLNYLPNSAARSMINRKSKIVGIAVPEINNPFLADLVVRLEDRLTKNNYSMMLCNTKFSREKIANFVDDLIMRNAEGLILVSNNVKEKRVIQKMGEYMKTISIGEHVAYFDCIKLADYAAACALTQYLIDMGHRKIAFVGFHPNSTQTMERLQGYKDTMEKNGIPLIERYMLKTSSEYDETKKLLEEHEPPTAIININDFNALKSYDEIEKKGLKVGREISVVGFDDISVARFLSPALTTVTCDTKKMAVEAVSMLIENIEQDSKGSSLEITLPSEMVVRDSVADLQSKK